MEHGAFNMSVASLISSCDVTENKDLIKKKNKERKKSKTSKDTENKNTNAKNKKIADSENKKKYKSKVKVESSSADDSNTILNDSSQSLNSTLECDFKDTSNSESIDNQFSDISMIKDESESILEESYELKYKNKQKVDHKKHKNILEENENHNRHNRETYKMFKQYERDKTQAYLEINQIIKAKMNDYLKNSVEKEKI